MLTFRILFSDELWQVAYLDRVGRMTEEKERKIKAGYYDLRHRLDGQEADGREAERNDATDEEPKEPKERKRKRLMHWVKSHVSDEALHHHHHTHEPALSWRELTKARHLKAKKLAAIKLKVTVSALALSGRHGSCQVLTLLCPSAPGCAAEGGVAGAGLELGGPRWRYSGPLSKQHGSRCGRDERHDQGMPRPGPRERAMVAA